ncbi:MAG: hypothetical protein AAF984_02970 [Verrucomicrobiota bacterium]
MKPGSFHTVVTASQRGRAARPPPPPVSFKSLTQGSWAAALASGPISVTPTAAQMVARSLSSRPMKSFITQFSG